MASAFSSPLNLVGEKRALLIGNNMYKQGRPLRCCINDANDLGKTLSTIHFHVTIGIGLTYEQMDLMINSFVRTICPGDLVVFFFSGHGVQWNDRNFLLPIDDDRITSSEMYKHRAVSAQATLQMIMDKNPSAAIFLLDCCRRYIIPDEIRLKDPGDSDGFLNMRAVAGSFIAFACNADKTALDGAKNGRNSIFTAHILEYIAQPNVNIEELMCLVCDGVMTDSGDKQCPFRVSGLRRKIYLHSTSQISAELQNKELQATYTTNTEIDKTIKAASNTMDKAKQKVNEAAKYDETSVLPHIFLNTRWIQNGTTVGGSNGPGSKLNQFNWPQNLYINDDQTLYVADYYNHRIVKWNCDAASGEVVAGGNGDGYGNNQLKHPSDVIVDKQTDSLIICDYENDRVVRWPCRGALSGQTIIEDVRCWGLTMDDEGFLYVSDHEKHEVRRWRVGEKSGTVVAGGNGQGDRLDQLNSPGYIFVDRNQSVYVSDCYNHRVMKWMKGAKEGTVVAGGRGRGRALTQLNSPEGVVVDIWGTVYVADGKNNRIMCWPQGAKTGSFVIRGNGQGKQSNQLNFPKGLSFDRQNNLYVVDSGNDRLQKFSIEISSIGK